MSQAPTTSAPGPAPAETVFTDVMRPGDKITVRLSGVPDEGYIIEVQVPDSGDITVPLLTRSFHVIGRNASDVATEITEAYKTAQIYSNPNVTIIPEERFVNIGGDVRSPARVLYTPDLTLLSAINSCGGFTDYANRHAVRILRGKQVIYVDAITASRTPGADPPLVPGDQVTVPRTMF
jgi:protein involved in polysaccharide export with SLBB domain